MFKLESLQKMMDVNEEDLKDYDTEQLRVMLGVFRYIVRVLERVINKQCKFYKSM
jgi:hypothetical protein